MPSYLTAFAVTDYASQSATAQYPPNNRVLSRPAWIQRTNLTLDMGIKMLAKYGEYLGINYDLPKMDQIAVPTFGGAMENWGLVIYGLVNRESNLFFYFTASSVYLIICFCNFSYDKVKIHFSMMHKHRQISRNKESYQLLHMNLPINGLVI